MEILLCHNLLKTYTKYLDQVLYQYKQTNNNA